MLGSLSWAAFGVWLRAVLLAQALAFQAAQRVLGAACERAERLARPQQRALARYTLLAVRRVQHTVRVGFADSSYFAALCLLDLSAWWAVWRQHEQLHADARAAVLLGQAAAGQRGSGPVCPSGAELAELEAAAVHSKAAYGWPAAAGLLSSWGSYLRLVTVMQFSKHAVRRVPEARHLEAVGSLAGVPAGDVLASAWQAHLHRPAHYVALDRRRRLVVVSIRGTLQLGDYLTLLDAVPVPCMLCAGRRGHAHGGMLASAKALLPDVAAALHGAAASDGSIAGWPVLVTGHSLGGGVGALLALMLADLAAAGDLRLSRLGRVRAVTVGTAAALCGGLADACAGEVTSVIYGADALPMFSVRGYSMVLREMRSASRAAALLDRISALLPAALSTAAVHSRTSSLASCGSLCGGGSAPGSVDGEDSLGGPLAVAAMLYPPGRILWVFPPAEGGSGRHTIVQASQAALRRFLVLPKTALHHVPDTYLAALDEYCAKHPARA